MNEWITANFQMDNYGGAIVFTNVNGDFISVNPILFSGSDFSTITTTPPTYTSLSTLTIAQQGWQKIFDQWKTEGIIS